MVERIFVGGLSVLSLLMGASLVLMGISIMTTHSSCPACDAMGGLFGIIFAGVGFLLLIVGAGFMLVVWSTRARKK